MKEWPIKAINQLICSKIGKRLLLQWEARKAAQWYGELFAMTSEVEPAYYYRAILRSISENDKANQIMEKFDQMSGNVEGTLQKRKLYGCHKG
jgi:tRNA G26 N,N-dimethylase Trm1